MILAFGGKLGSGKSTLTRYVRYRYGFEQKAFARRLKELTHELYDWDLRRLNDADYKEEVLARPVSFGSVQKNQLSELTGIPEPQLPNLSFEFKTRREALQLIGTEFFRSYDKDYWVNYMAETLQPKTNYVIDDIRFVNELKMLKQRQAKTIYILKPDAEEVDHRHSSELSLLPKYFDYVIHNDQDIAKLIERFDKIYAPMCLGNQREEEYYSHYSDKLSSDSF